MFYLLAIGLFGATLCLDLYTDLKLWHKNKPVNHVRGFLLRLIGLVPVILLLHWKSFVLVGACYWFLFDGLYNLHRSFNWWFTGSDDNDDAQTDNFLQSLPLWLQIATKITCISIGLLFYLGTELQ